VFPNENLAIVQSFSTSDVVARGILQQGTDTEDVSDCEHMQCDFAAGFCYFVVSGAPAAKHKQISGTCARVQNPGFRGELLDARGGEDKVRSSSIQTGQEVRLQPK
jgi:hypothetical protein